MNEIERFQKNPNIKVETADPGFGSQVGYWFNMQRSITKDVNFRQAVAYALDRKYMIEKATYGTGTLEDSMLHKFLPWYSDKVQKYPYDVARAKQILDENGYKVGPDGFRITPAGDKVKIDIVYQADVYELLKAAEIIKEQLKVVGIDVMLRGYDTAAAWKTIFIDYDFDTAILRMSSGPEPTTIAIRFYHSAFIEKKTFRNACRYINSRVDALFDAATKEGDFEKRRQIFEELQVIVSKEVPILILWGRRWVTATNTYVKSTYTPTIGPGWYMQEALEQVWNLKTVPPSAGWPVGYTYVAIAIVVVAAIALGVIAIRKRQRLKK